MGCDLLIPPHIVEFLRKQGLFAPSVWVGGSKINSEGEVIVFYVNDSDTGPYAVDLAIGETSCEVCFHAKLWYSRVPGGDITWQHHELQKIMDGQFRELDWTFRAKNESRKNPESPETHFPSGTVLPLVKSSPPTLLPARWVHNINETTCIAVSGYASNGVSDYYVDVNAEDLPTSRDFWGMFHGSRVSVEMNLGHSGQANTGLAGRLPLRVLTWLAGLYGIPTAHVGGMKQIWDDLRDRMLKEHRLHVLSYLPSQIVISAARFGFVAIPWELFVTTITTELHRKADSTSAKDRCDWMLHGGKRHGPVIYTCDEIW